MPVGTDHADIGRDDPAGLDVDARGLEVEDGETMPPRRGGSLVDLWSTMSTASSERLNNSGCTESVTTRTLLLACDTAAAPPGGAADASTDQNRWSTDWPIWSQ
jgi:hypothetical protein